MNLCRKWTVAALAVVVTGCAAPSLRRGVESSAESPQRAVVLAVDPDCCKGPTAQLKDELKQALSRSARVRALRPTLAQPPGPRSINQQVQALVQQVKQLYMTMHMERALDKLERALGLVRKHVARGLTPEELATIHLYLVAVHQSLGRAGQVQQHAAAAVRYQPQLRPDPDIFSPLVRRAIDQAREQRQAAQVSIHSTTPGASVTWDGRERGQAPATLSDQGTGEHYLFVEHPLYRTWAEVVHVSTNTQLQIKLEAADPQHLLAGLSDHPELGGQACKLLEVDTIIWARQRAGSPDLELSSTSIGGTSTTTHLALGSPPLVIERAARTVLGRQTAAVASSASSPETAPAITPAITPATSQPARDQPTTRRSYWRRYWWAWALAGTAVVATAVALPLATQSEKTPNSGVQLVLP